MLPKIKPILPFLVGSFFGLMSFPAVISGTIFQIAYLIVKQVIKKIRGKK